MENIPTETQSLLTDTTGFVRTYPPSRPEREMIYWLLVRKNEILVQEGAVNTSDDDYTPLTLPLSSQSEPPIPNLNPEEGLHLGTYNGADCVAFTVSEETVLPPGLKAVGLRSLYGQITEGEYTIAGYAVQLLHFQRISKYCPVCATATVPLAASWAKECPNCGHTTYPPVSPAVLILVHDGGDRILLAQKAGWGTRYSILAGFVEPGESLEGCVIRETLEEAGITVHTLGYDGSQSWPFPHQVMIGFTAVGDPDHLLTLDTAELERAAWFDVTALPDLPPPLSLSRQMIDRWVASRNQDIQYPNLAWN